ncbi:MAG TPA: metalloregulator ArsR/SmtB family transcription factor [Bryobacteraceae bacterium]|jgi:DNA-binding transcriptional ArsR family regulator|nr:metalloregulator ArsR/SmtB family transcription factor [Bryobacteraceae bacterium]
MPKPRSNLRLAEAALLFAALGDETRLRLLRQLSEAGPASISVLAHNFQVSRQAVTKHLQFLAAASIIQGKREGREHVWTLNPARLGEAQRCLEIIARGWDDALARLKAHIEEGI